MADLTPLPSASSKLRAMLAEDNAIVVCPGVYDGFTARLAIKTGFNILYMTGAGTTMSRLGAADLGLATMNDMRDNATMIANIDPKIPVIADADTGYGGPLMVGRTTAAYINGGVAAFHLEDQATTKRCGHLSNKQLVPASTFNSRIRAAAATRTQLSRDIVIIARTDALADHGYDEAVSRLKGAVECGADVAFLEGVRSAEEARKFCAEMKELGVPALYNCVPGGVSPLFDVQQAKNLGYKIVITPTLALGAVYEAVGKAFKDLKEAGETKGNAVAVRDLFESCGLKEAVEFDQSCGGKGFENGA
ncbi:Phosphoenolpyruvate/pyruvate [Glarea lozoyensis ATCC 20868]|uniref:Phosphoenolpyruvate/pyruvate n=1 Tax=Glarea lozoyensis (strain ATCC 20868 / MF5171) TaxID=1116229 RepID=S3CDK7_GLAL2|nr:Phosphoenolpyruvate/pyruvate [Glarea lozoyensis ATCC 20868]EPE24607.1 Phosphoenolpyruvate/pyruvate [Glarea lozoyensis ATCC 20868]